MIVHTWTCKAGHEVELLDEGEKASRTSRNATDAAIRQTREMLRRGCTRTMKDGTTCGKPVTEAKGTK